MQQIVVKFRIENSDYIRIYRLGFFEKLIRN